MRIIAGHGRPGSENGKDGKRFLSIVVGDAHPATGRFHFAGMARSYWPSTLHTLTRVRAGHARDLNRRLSGVTIPAAGITIEIIAPMLHRG